MRKSFNMFLLILLASVCLHADTYEMEATFESRGKPLDTRQWGTIDVERGKDKLVESFRVKLYLVPGGENKETLTRNFQGKFIRTEAGIEVEVDSSDQFDKIDKGLCTVMVNQWIMWLDFPHYGDSVGDFPTTATPYVVKEGGINFNRGVDLNKWAKVANQNPDETGDTYMATNGVAGYSVVTLHIKRDREKKIETFSLTRNQGQDTIVQHFKMNLLPPSEQAKVEK